MTLHLRVPSRPRLRQADRGAISSYEQAVWRLVALREDPEITDFAYDTAVNLMADVFWCSDFALRRDVRKAAAQIGQNERP